MERSTRQVIQRIFYKVIPSERMAVARMRIVMHHWLHQTQCSVEVVVSSMLS
jgi:hypothetical protein